MMIRVRDRMGPFYVGRQISELTIIGPLFRIKQYMPRKIEHLWYCVCQCSCGKYHLSNVNSFYYVLKRNSRVSCGHLRREHGRRIQAKISPPVLITAWGETKSRRAWVRDSRCRVSEAGLRYRLFQGEPPESALARRSRDYGAQVTGL